MKKALIISLGLATYLTGYGQGLTQSADGKSTIPLRGASIGLDIAKTSLSIGYNNLDKVVKATEKHVFYGLDVNVKNEEGIGSLFSSGNLVPEGSGTAYAGYTISNYNNSAYKKNRRIRSDAITRFNIHKESLRQEIRQVLQAEITDELSFDNSLRDKLTDDLKKMTACEAFADDPTLQNTSTDSEGIKDAKKSLKQLAKHYAQRMKELVDAHTGELDQLQRDFSHINYRRFSVFVLGGIAATGFKHFKGIDSSNLANSIEDISTHGGNIGLGVNYQWRNFWIGITYSYRSTNNFDDLKKREFTLRTTTIIDNTELIEEKKFDGYMGKYGKVQVNDLNIDLVYRLRLDNEYQNFLLINPYLRGTIFSRDTSLLTNKTNIGTGFYFFKTDSKFLGGVYFELPDVNNNAAKAKPLTEQDILPARKRLSFGVVAKFSLSSIVGY